ncbi:DUF4192 domain-containing protein [Modestobacter sp. NPDC049651]|uniref:DUF4192 domain-containing protein n=1 Tax=unclassified Modestobacter TaxID=2643866 RepID=UPI0033E038EA
MAADPLPTVRLSGPGEFAAALPYLVGFSPRESLVVVSVRGPNRRFGLTARVDLPPPAVRARVLAGLVRAVATERPAGVLAAVVSEDADVPSVPVRAGGAGGLPLPDLPHRALVREAVLAFRASGVAVHDVLLVRGGRWWSYDRAGPDGVPGEGTRLPAGTSALAAAAAVSGQVVEDDRAELAQRIAPPASLVGMAHACDEVGAAMAVRSIVDGWDAVVAESLRLVEEAVATMVRPGSARLTDEQVARLAWGLRDTEVRDAALRFALGHTSVGAEVLWTELTRRVPAPLDAAPATLLAVSAWVRGNGAMANVALERALTSEPSYTFAGLLRTALDACTPPDQLRRLLHDVTGDLPGELPGTGAGTGTGHPTRAPGGR